MAKKENAVLLLDRDGLTFAESAGQSGVVFRYPPDVIHDLEVINKEQLISQVTAFISNNKLTPANVILLLTDAILFTKDIFPLTQPTGSPGQPQPSKETVPPKPLRDEDEALKREEQIKHFLDSVPFENTASKVYSIEKGVRVVAANRDFYEAIESVFESMGSTILAVAPTFLVWKDDQTVALNGGLVSQVFSKADFLRQQSLPQHYVEITPEAVQEKKFSLDLNSKSKPRAAALISVFVVLLGVFGFMLTAYLKSSDTTTQSHASLEKKPSLPAAFQSTTLAPTTPLSPLPVGSASAQPAVDKTNVKIQINFSSASSSQESVLASDLESQGFTNVSANTQTGSGNKPLVIFRISTPQTIRDLILQPVKKQFPAVSEQQTADLQFDGVINLP